MTMKDFKQINSTKNATPVRHPKFDFSKPVETRDPGTLLLMHFLNALSMFLPMGETNFINSIKNFENELKNPELLEKARDFYGQESAHTSAHMSYNCLLKEHGFDADRVARKVENWKKFRENRIKDDNKYGTNRKFLALTACTEYVICCCAEQILKMPEILDRVETNLANLWKWHAVEEIEHKAVAHDIYYAVGGRYRERMFALSLLTFGILVFGILEFVYILRKEKLLFKLKTWTFLFRFTFFRPGFFVKIIPGYMKLFKFNYKPWANDNLYLIEKWKSEYPEINHSDVSVT